MSSDAEAPAPCPATRLAAALDRLERAATQARSRAHDARGRAAALEAAAADAVARLDTLLAPG